LILSATCSGFIFSFDLPRMIGFCLIINYPKPLFSCLIRSSNGMSRTFCIPIIGKHPIKVLYYRPSLTRANIIILHFGCLISIPTKIQRGKDLYIL
jgi:hypothetical protein